jgi:CelD/BcsL family acetyltransferase involved in cellulose biosynthesis
MKPSVEELTTIEALETIEAEWSDLCDRSMGTSPFQRPEWIIAWCRHADAPRILTLAVREGGRLVALAPWLIYDDDGRRVVGFLAGGVSDYHDVVVDPAAREMAYGALFEHLESRRAIWDECNFEELAPRSTLRDARAPAHWAEARREQLPCPRLELPEGPPSLDTIVPSRQLARLRKYRSRAARTGRLALDLVSAASRRHALHELLALHDARRSTEGRLSPAIRSFHEAVVARLSGPSCSAEIHRLTLDGVVVAHLYGFALHRTLYCYMQAFDPQFAHASPGALLVGSVLEQAQARGFAVVDFLRGTEPYKLAWGAVGSPNLARRFRHGI